MRTLIVTTLLLAASSAPAAEPAAARIDGLLAARWAAAGVTPAAAADDAAFLRRAWIDLAGRVPPALNVRAFLDDPRPDKRSRLVEELLASEEFAEHWGRAWAQRLTARRPVKQDGYDNRVLADYLRDSLAGGRSYRQVVRELLTGDGLQDASGPANFLLRYEAKPPILAGAVGKQFLGITVHCAQCHDHFFAKWKQDDFWGLAAFFGRTKRVNSEEGDLAGILEARRGDLTRPDPTGKKGEDGNVVMVPVPPRLPLGGTPAAGPRRTALAEWVTADDNPYFARAAVNQVWGQLFGRPLVASLDDLEAVSHDANGPLLDLLADDFRAGGYDLKKLLRSLVFSRAYNLGSQAPADAEAADKQLRQFARFPMQALSVDQLYQSVVQATGHAASDPDEAAAASPDDPPEDNDRPVESLGEHALTVQRTLVLLNGEYVGQAVKAGAKLAVTIQGRKVGPAQVEWLFLATLSRRPTSDESAAMLELARGDKGRRGMEDVLWALVNSAEFTTNH
jgi:hypothetical protein